MMASLSIALPASNRTAMLLGDDAASIYSVSAKGVEIVDSILWQDSDFVSKAAAVLKDKCKARPVILINDMTDQHFKGGQRMPKVGAMDKANVLERKLQIAFPNHKIRGALPVKTPPASLSGSFSKSGQNKAELMYLFAAVPDSEAVTKTIQAVSAAMVTIAGFCLLPVESSSLVEKLSKYVAGKGKTVARWAVFIGHHKSGSLRQVITRDGQLAMTRMTPLSASIEDPLAWAEAVHQEYKSTLGYLSRFGYSSSEETNVFVIGGKESVDAFKAKVANPQDIYSFTAPQAAHAIGVKIGVQKETRFADPIHVGYIARKSKLNLPLKIQELSGINTPRLVVKYGSIALTLGLISIASYGGYLMQSHSGVQQQIEQKKQAFTRANEEYQTALAQMETLGIDFKVYQAAYDTYSELQDREINLLGIMKGIGDALGPNLRLDDLGVERSGAEDDNAQASTRGRRAVYRAPVAEGPGEDNTIKATLALTFPNDLSQDEGRKDLDDFEARLKANLPDYDVEIISPVRRPEYSQRISGVANASGRVQNQDTSQDDFSAKIEIRGPIDKQSGVPR